MLSLAASLAFRLSQENVFLSFVSQEYESIGDVYGFLAHLANLAPKAGQSLLETLPGSTDYSVVFTAEKRGTIPASMWAAAYFVFTD
jgi:hypothetical protein